jgi:hypothetical protein
VSGKLLQVAELLHVAIGNFATSLVPFPNDRRIASFQPALSCVYERRVPTPRVDAAVLATRGAVVIAMRPTRAAACPNNGCSARATCIVRRRPARGEARHPSPQYRDAAGESGACARHRYPGGVQGIYAGADQQVGQGAKTHRRAATLTICVDTVADVKNHRRGSSPADRHFLLPVSTMGLRQVPWQLISPGSSQVTLSPRQFAPCRLPSLRAASRSPDLLMPATGEAFRST